MTVPNPVDLVRSLRLAALLTTLLLAPAAAAPRSIDDCEAIKQADAYNQCLASFGPAAHTGGRTTTPPPGADKSDGAARSSAQAPRQDAQQDAQQDAPRARRHGRARPPWLAARQAEGRQRMERRRHRAGGITVLSHKNGRVRTIIDMRRK